MNFESSAAGLLVIAAIALFWIGMLGLLLRRSLVGMLVGLLFAWISVAMSAIGFSILQGDNENVGAGGALVLCVAVMSFLQATIGLSIVVARIRRRGTLDADDAGLLEG
jgi:NADH:ubiquinone oxidoreductase subunit K